MRRRRGFSLVELLVAVMVAAVGLGAVLTLFIQTARAADRDGRRAQARALGQGLVAQWQAMPREHLLATLSQGEGEWPPEPAPFDLSLLGDSTLSGMLPDLTWQWRWEGDLPSSGPLQIELHISSDWDNPLETVTLPAAL